MKIDIKTVAALTLVLDVADAVASGDLSADDMTIGEVKKLNNAIDAVQDWIDEQPAIVALSSIVESEKTGRGIWW